MTKLFILFFIFLSFLLGCAKKESDSSKNDSSSSSGSSTTSASGSITLGSNSLSGTYESNCLTGSLVSAMVSLELAPSDVKGVKANFVVTSSTTVSDEYFYYTDETCSTISFVMKNPYTNYADTGSTHNSNNVVSYKWGNGSIYTGNSSAETFWETKSGGNWDLTVGTETATTNTNTSTFYNLILISGSTLKMGDEQEGSSTFGDSTTVGTTFTWTKQ